jgi:hypothetical protein
MKKCLLLICAGLISGSAFAGNSCNLEAVFAPGFLRIITLPLPAIQDGTQDVQTCIQEAYQWRDRMLRDGFFRKELGSSDVKRLNFVFHDEVNGYEVKGKISPTRSPQ